VAFRCGQGRILRAERSLIQTIRPGPAAMWMGRALLLTRQRSGLMASHPPTERRPGHPGQHITKRGNGITPFSAGKPGRQLDPLLFLESARLNDDIRRWF